jgi:outer membrane protein TolC
MTHRDFSKRSLSLFAATLLAGCASLEAERALIETNQSLNTFTRGDLELRETVTLSVARSEARAALLAAPVTQESAVRLALLGSPALQALLASKRADIAEARRAGRIGNPTLSYERLRDHGETEIGRVLSVGLLELLTLPKRQRIAAAEARAAELQLAMAVVDEVTRVRQTWVRAVAAEQRRRYAERVLESGALSAELARRMEAAGNFNRIARARQQSFEADARAQSVVARQQAIVEREALVRALGLDDTEAARLQLPERLPDLPQAAVDPQTLSARATKERLDVELAEVNYQAASRRAGLGEVTTRTDIELAVLRDGEARGFEVELRLPVFDWGDLERSALDGRTLAAANELEATLRAAGSHLRESYSGYLAAHAVARNYIDEILPLRRTISDENLLRYNGMFIGVFELLADAREQITTVMAGIDAQQQFWLAEAALQTALIGRPAATSVSAPVSGAATASAGADH